MAKTNDYTKQVEEQREAAERRENGGLTLEEHQKKVQEEEAKAQKAEQQKHMEEVEAAKKRAGFVASDTDHTDDTDPSTGRTTINNRGLGATPETGGTIPPNGNNGNGNGGNGPVPPNGNRGPGQAAPIPQRPQQPLVSKDEFKSKGKSFFNPDVPKNFWNTLEDKLDKMLSGNTAEECAQNMFFGMIELFFDMITNAIDHRRKERERQDEEYMKTKEAYEKEVGISGRHKKALVIMALAKRRGLNYQSVVSEDDKKAMYKDLKSKDLLKDVADMYQAATGTECTKAEAKKMIETFGKSSLRSRAAIQDQLRGVKLNDPMFKNIGEKGTRATAQRIHGDYQTCKAHEDQLDIDREALRKMRVNQAQQQMQQQGRQGPGPQQQPQPRPQQQGRNP